MIVDLGEVASPPTITQRRASTDEVFGYFSGSPLIPSAADVEALLQHGAVIRGDVRWKQAGRFRWKMEVAFDETYEDARVKLVGTYNDKIRNLSYAVIWASCRIRALDIGGPPHKNPGTNTPIETPHKHKWSDADRDRWVYRPTDITATNVEGVFRQFLTECNVRFEGAHFGPEEQGELF